MSTKPRGKVDIILEWLYRHLEEAEANGTPEECIALRQAAARVEVNEHLVAQLKALEAEAEQVKTRMVELEEKLDRKARFIKALEEQYEIQLKGIERLSEACGDFILPGDSIIDGAARYIAELSKRIADLERQLDAERGLRPREEERDAI